MKILFVVKDIDYIDPIGIMLLSSLAKSQGHHTHLGILARENILDKIRDIKPDVLAYSASTGEHKYYFEINNKIKSKYKDLFTIMGGPHTTYYPECITDSTLDSICIGEGEGAFIELLEKLQSREDISRIKNILTAEGSVNGLRDLYKDLDSLPFPDRALFYETTEMGQFPLKSFMASRGCPYNCTYCFNHVFRKLYNGKADNFLRRHSVDYIINEILQVKNRYPLQFVKFYDDIFVYRVDEWLEDFVKRYKKEINLPFHCLTRADLFTKGVAQLLKEAGCFSISMSIESGNSYLRNELLKRNMTNEQILQAFGLCQKYKIKTFCNSILGLPFSKIEDDIQTVDLNVKCKVSFAEFPIFHPYPGTSLGSFCIEKGIYTKGYSDLHMSYMNKSPLSCFSEREKNIQKNISNLGLLVVWFPFLRNMIMKYLIYLPHNKLSFLSYYFAKAYLVKTRVYPFKLGVRNLWRLFLKSLNLEKFKRTDEVFTSPKGGMS